MSRFFIDHRVGCIAVRDRLHPKYDESCPGLHYTMEDVLFYAKGVWSNDEWTVSEIDVEKANQVLSYLQSFEQKLAISKASKSQNKARRNNR